jgi:hypothetical protein
MTTLTKYISKDRHNLHADAGAHLVPKKVIPVGAACEFCISLMMVQASPKQESHHYCTLKSKVIKLYNRCELYQYSIATVTRYD